jgi:hypothetical protein
VNQWLDSTKGTAMDWAKWHDLYEVSIPLKERLIAVRKQIAAAASKVTGKSLHLVQ